MASNLGRGLGDLILNGGKSDQANSKMLKNQLKLKSREKEGSCI